MVTVTDTPRKLRIAVLGVGRMGLRHALNVAYAAPRAELAGIADVKEVTLKAAAAQLPPTPAVLDSMDLIESPDVDAVLIATQTSTHADLAIAAIKAGKHVLLEKPIAVDIEDSRPVVEAAAQSNVKVMVGFSRRFDESLCETKAMLDRGELGTPYLLKSCTNDMFDPTGFFMAYSKASGGIFIDCGIHDIDLARWLLNTSASGKKEVQRVFGSGMNARHPELADTDDCDNGMGIIEFTNGARAMIHLSRTAVHGHDTVTELFGTEGKVIVNGNPAINRLEIRDSHGVRSLSHPTYYERFREAFVNELNTFVQVVLEDERVPTPPEDALKAAQIAIALTHSFRTGVPVDFDNEGEPILN
ncbi:hypothetical protein CspeluHIS016_0304360 [Cutaneotrichosporon spelunceum]|uniref:NAD(P)-binding protein n=1 Tax=Cutaneotrichosporon spelunceum TaxID=1672016 RepID=A0AAD3TU76_9TREE|nr:hypothetical protein CspeluHIS016_0304360 [Cutaneotrichosporon spelunceum]